MTPGIFYAQLSLNTRLYIYVYRQLDHNQYWGALIHIGPRRYYKANTRISLPEDFDIAQAREIPPKIKRDFRRLFMLNRVRENAFGESR